MLALVDAGGAGQVGRAVDARIQAGKDPVLGVDPCGADGDRALGACAYRRRGRQHGGFDAVRAQRRHGQVTAGVDRRAAQARLDGGHAGPVAQQFPGAFVGVVLVAQLDAVVVLYRVTDVLVNLLPEHPAVVEHARAGLELGELVVLVVVGGLDVVDRRDRSGADDVARHRQADRHRHRRLAADRHCRSDRAQVGIDHRVVVGVDRDLTAAGLERQRPEQDLLGISVGRATDAVERHGAGATDCRPALGAGGHGDRRSRAVGDDL